VKGKFRGASRLAALGRLVEGEGVEIIGQNTGRMEGNVHLSAGLLFTQVARDTGRDGPGPEAPPRRTSRYPGSGSKNVVAEDSQARTSPSPSLRERSFSQVLFSGV